MKSKTKLYWKTYAAVPASVLAYEYNNLEKIEAKDPAYLVHLNSVFNSDWLYQDRAERAAMAKRAKLVGAPQTKLPCNLDPCKVLIPIKEYRAGNRLCESHQALVKKMGVVGYIGYRNTGEDDAGA